MARAVIAILVNLMPKTKSTQVTAAGYSGRTDLAILGLGGGERSPSIAPRTPAGIGVRGIALDSKGNLWVASNFSLDFPPRTIPDGASAMLQFQLAVEHLQKTNTPEKNHRSCQHDPPRRHATRANGLHRRQSQLASPARAAAGAARIFGRISIGTQP
jgi:hypothetical protein